jgi:hypothetical protein
LPNGWKVKIFDDVLYKNYINIISEDVSRESVVGEILNNINANGYFYKKLKLLVIKSNQKVVK